MMIIITYHDYEIHQFKNPGHKKENIFKPCVAYPSCLQTTLASIEDQKLSHTAPHVLFRQISTLPSKSFCPSTSLMSPSTQVLLLTVNESMLMLYSVKVYINTLTLTPHSCIITVGTVTLVEVVTVQK